MKKLQNIIEQIKNLNCDELMQLNNYYCEENNYNDSNIFNNDEEFLKLFFENDVARAVSFGDFNYNHDYVKFNGYGNLKSFYSLDCDDLVETLETIAQFAIDNDDDFGGLLDLDV
jgi:hypothetical protein